MHHFKRVWWAGVIFFIVLLAPETGLCNIGGDPYLHKTLVLYLDLEYQKDFFEQGAVKTDSSTFVQTYSLLFSGNLLSRRFMIYDLGVAFTDTQTSHKTQSNKSSNDYKDIDFTARTTLLPLSAIPLTLYGERRNLYTNSVKSTETIYGLDWLARLRTLPTTHVSVQRTDFVSPSTEIVNTDAAVSLLKRLGPTLNVLDYIYSSNDDKTRNVESTLHSVSFNNRTAISRSTDFFFGASRSIADDTTASGESRLSGLSLGLNSQTSRDVNQVHRYNYYSNSSPGLDRKGQTYSGLVNFVPSKAFGTKIELAAANYVDETPTAKNTQDNLATAASLNYHITNRLILDANVQNSISLVKLQSSGAPTIDSKGTINRTDDSLTYLITEHLSASEAVSYNDLQAKFDGQPVLKYTLITELTNLRYGNNYHKWLKYWATFGVGFADEKRDGESRTGAIDNIDVGFTAAPDFSKYVGGKAEVSYKRIDKLTQGLLLDSKDQHYYLEAHNKYLKKYADVTVSYERGKTTSLWLNTLAAPLLVSSAIAPSAPVNVTTPRVSLSKVFDQSFESYRALLTSNYFRGTSVSASAEHRIGFNPVAGTERSDSGYFFASHARPLWKGTLQGNLSYNTIKSTSSSGTSSSSYDALINLTYTRQLLRDLGWQAIAQYDNKRVDITKWQTYMVQNALNYILREWYFSASHTYTLTHALGVSSTDNTVYFRVSRTFVRYF